MLLKMKSKTETKTKTKHKEEAKYQDHVFSTIEKNSEDEMRKIRSTINYLMVWSNACRITFGNASPNYVINPSRTVCVYWARCWRQSKVPTRHTPPIFSKLDAV